jgi:hypothetical protein
MNAKNQGVVSNPAQVSSVRNFLTSNFSKDAEIVTDKVAKRTTVKAKGDMLVYFSELEHQ